MEQEQESTPLDLDKINAEKQNLHELIKPAVTQFIRSTGLLPVISISQTTFGTKCGYAIGNWEIHISVSI